MRMNRSELARTRKIAVVFRGNYCVEEPQVRSHCLREEAMARRGQNHRAPSRARVSKILNDLGAVRQSCHVRFHSRCQLSFRRGLTMHQPEWDSQKIEWPVPDQKQQRFMQQISGNERSVQIDHENEGVLRNRFRAALWCDR